MELRVHCEGREWIHDKFCNVEETSEGSTTVTDPVEEAVGTALVGYGVLAECELQAEEFVAA